MPCNLAFSRLHSLQRSDPICLLDSGSPISICPSQDGGGGEVGSVPVWCGAEVGEEEGDDVEEEDNASEGSMLMGVRRR